VLRAQSKHIDIDRRAHYIRHLCHAKKINYKHIPGTDNTADAFTKAHSPVRLSRNSGIRNNMQHCATWTFDEVDRVKRGHYSKAPVTRM
jgi:hypothetical protein